MSAGGGGDPGGGARGRAPGRPESAPLPAERLPEPAGLWAGVPVPQQSKEMTARAAPPPRPPEGEKRFTSEAERLK